MSRIVQTKQGGFAVVEAVLVLVIVGLLAGTGYWVVSQRKKINNLNNSTVSDTTAATQSSTPAPATVSQVDPKLAGTSAGVIQTVTLGGQAESQADSKGVSSISSGVTSTDSAANNIGSSYNENNF